MTFHILMQKRTSVKEKTHIMNHKAYRRWPYTLREIPNILSTSYRVHLAEEA